MMFCCVPQTSLGAGRQLESNGGPPEARLGCRGLNSMGRDVARVGRRTTRRREKWRAEVGPMLPGAGPRLLRLEVGSGISFERLVLSEIGDRKTQGVDGDKLVGN